MKKTNKNVKQIAHTQMINAKKKIHEKQGRKLNGK